MKFGFVPMISTLLMTANYKLDILMLDAFPNVTTANVGVYSLGVSLAEKIWMIPDALKDILLSKLAKGKKVQEVSKVIRLSLPIMIFFVLCIVILGQPFISFVYGAEYSDAYQITLLIITGTIFMVFYKMINSYYIVEGHRFLSFVMLLITAVINIVLNAILIPLLGMSGAAIASLISYISCGLMFTITFSRMTKETFGNIFIIKKSDIQQLFNKLKKS
jgi:O-antigen/teichoic acid export membrane protein